MGFIQWLANSDASSIVQNVLWVIPAVQTVHIITVAVVISSVGMIVLRFFGMASLDNSVAEVAHRYIPRIWLGVLILFLSGCILITGEPQRELTNTAFWIKMVLVVTALIGLRLFQTSVARNPAAWDRDAGETRWKVAAAASMVLFFSIIVAGRWIAYAVSIY